MRQLFLGLCFFATTAFAISDCRYEVFRPNFIKNRFEYALQARGLAIVPATRVSTSTYPVGTLAVIRNARSIHALLETTVNRFGETDSVTLKTVNGDRLFSFKEFEKPNQQSVQIFNRFDQEEPALRVQKDKGWGTSYHVNQSHGGFSYFIIEFDAMWDFAMSHLTGGTQTVPLMEMSHEELFWLSVDTSPRLKDFRHFLSASMIKGAVVINGRVGSDYAYNLLLRTAWKHFGSQVRLNIVIDQRLPQIYPVAPYCS